MQKQNRPLNFRGHFVGDRPDGFRYRDISSNISILSIPYDFGFNKGWGVNFTDAVMGPFLSEPLPGMAPYETDPSSRDFWCHILRRLRTARHAPPNPNRSIVAGSGTGVTGASEAVQTGTDPPSMLVVPKTPS